MKHRIIAINVHLNVPFMNWHFDGLNDTLTTLTSLKIANELRMCQFFTICAMETKCSKKLYRFLIIYFVIVGLTGYTVLVRNCVVDNGETNSDSEIGRLSHCGWLKVMKYNDQIMNGCIVTCETDGCNDAERSSKISAFLLTSTFIAYVILMPV